MSNGGIEEEWIIKKTLWCERHVLTLKPVTSAAKVLLLQRGSHGTRDSDLALALEIERQGRDYFQTGPKPAPNDLSADVWIGEPQKMTARPRRFFNLTGREA